MHLFPAAEFYQVVYAVSLITSFFSSVVPSNLDDHPFTPMPAIEIRIILVRDVNSNTVPLREPLH